MVLRCSCAPALSLLPCRQRRFGLVSKQPKPDISQASTKVSTEQKLFTAVILAFFIWAGYEALQLSLLGGVFGGIVSIAMIIAMACTYGDLVEATAVVERRSGK